MEVAMNYVTIMKALCIIGIVLTIILLYNQIKKNLATEEGKAQWAEQKKHFAWNAMVGVVANFFDTLGIGSYATSSALFKIKGSIDDLYIPGTLNVGDTIPVLVEAFLFFGFVDVDPLTLVTMLVAAVIGAFVGAGIVTKWNRHAVRLGLGVGLLVLGIVMACRAAGVGPFGIQGTALGLSGGKLIISIIIQFFLGALMNIGVGLYAPCLALVSVMGMNVQAAFPIMMGSCAYLMAFGNGPKFIRENRFDMVCTLAQAIFGVIGVLLAYFIVHSLPITVLTWVVVCVVFFTSFMFFRDAAKDKKEA
jgi:uncharacterized membrane protein YfcA